MSLFLPVEIRIASENCHHPVIKRRTGSDRHMDFRGMRNLPVPDEMELPTCTACGEWFVDLKTATALDAKADRIAAEMLGRLPEGK